jgi:hypothetical protein
MKNIHIHILILSLCLIISSELSAQLIHSKRDVIEASAHVKGLNKGVLIIQIATQTKKIEQLEKLIQSNPKSKRFKKMLEETTTNSDALLEATIKAYTDNFDFSELLFMPDTMVSRLYAGERTGIFIDGTGEINETIKLETEDFYICYIGFPKDSNTGKKSLVIVDEKGNGIGAPFPYATPFYTLGKLILGKSDAESIKDAVIDQNKKLKAFLEWIRLKELENRA